jgi:hypothetical protein
LSRLPIIAAAIVLLASVCLLSCAGSGKIPAADLRAGNVTGVYRVHLQGDGAESRKFRLLLFAAEPDRLHAEALSAVGSTELIVDGGGGRISISIVRERLSYVGDADAAAMEKVIGIALTLEQLVRILLTGEESLESFEMERQPRRGGGLPSWLKISSEGRSAEFKLKRLRPMRARAELLGTGAAPERMKVLPLEELEALQLPGS